MEDTAANLTGDSKGAERRRGGGPMALGRAALMGDDGGCRRHSGTMELGTDGAMGRRSSGGGGRRRSGTAAAASRRRGGSRGRRWRDADQENHQVLGKGEEEGRYRGGGLLSRVEPRPGTKDPFVPGRGSTRDKRYFWAGRENSQPAAHL